LTKNQTKIELPLELESFSSILLESKDKEVYENLTKIWELVGEENLRSLSYQKQTPGEKEELEKLRQLDISAQKELNKIFDNLDEYTRELRKTREIVVYEDGLSEIFNPYEQNDLQTSYILQERLRNLFELYVKENDLTTEYTDGFSQRFMFGQMSQVTEEEYPPYELNWNGEYYPNLTKYLHLFESIKQKHSNSAWYIFENLNHIVQLTTKQRTSSKFPVNVLDKLLKQYPYSESSIKTAWITLYKEIRDTSHQKIKLYINLQTANIHIDNNSVKKYDPDSDEFKILKGLALNNGIIKYSELDVYNDSDTINDTIKNIRRRLKLSKNQLINKGGTASFSGVKIIQED
jgi:hypothetical protein